MKQTIAELNNERAQILKQIENLRGDLAAIDRVVSFLSLKENLEQQVATIETIVTRPGDNAPLADHIRHAINRFGQPFYITDIENFLQRERPQIAAKVTRAYLSNALWRLLQDKFIDIAVQGAGRRPTLYKKREEVKDEKGVERPTAEPPVA
jgi:hypothetical protein